MNTDNSSRSMRLGEDSQEQAECLREDDGLRPASDEDERGGGERGEGSDRDGGTRQGSSVLAGVRRVSLFQARPCRGFIR